MMRALWSAASGMKSQQDNMDVVAHNLANVNTFGAKKVRAEFHDLLYQTLRPAGAESGADSQYPTGLQIGLGDRLAARNVSRQISCGFIGCVHSMDFSAKPSSTSPCSFSRETSERFST